MPKKLPLAAVERIVVRLNALPEFLPQANQ